MARYRMRVFKPGYPENELWETLDIQATDDATAEAAAKALYHRLGTELTQARASYGLKNFSLSEGGRLVCKGR
jgi:hypothetical protein